MCYSLPAALIYGCLARYVCIYPTGAGSVSPHLCPRLLRVVFKKRQRCFQQGCFCFLLPLCACSKLGQTSAEGGSEVTSGSKAAKCRPEHGQWRFLDKLVGVLFTACSTRVERVEQVFACEGRLEWKNHSARGILGWPELETLGFAPKQGVF